MKICVKQWLNWKEEVGEEEERKIREELEFDRAIEDYLTEEDERKMLEELDLY